MDPYDILNVSGEASDAEIKKAFRKLAAKHHPDKGGDEEKFKQINEAYSTIGTAQKRQEHEASQHFGGGGHHNDPFKDFGFGDIFGNLFGGRPQPRQQPKEQTDEDVMFNLKISLAHVKKGATQEITFNRNKKCFTCHGTGGENKKTCNACNGQGVQIRRQGPMIQQTTCQACRAMGFTFDNMCNTCAGMGLIKVKESIAVTIKSE